MAFNWRNDIDVDGVTSAAANIEQRRRQ